MRCGKEIGDHRFCPHCGARNVSAVDVDDDRVKETSPLKMEGQKQKSPRKALAIAVIAGLFGFMGMGHIYAGFRKKGVRLLLTFFFMIFVFFFIVTVMINIHWIFLLIQMGIMGMAWVQQALDLKRMMEGETPGQVQNAGPHGTVDEPGPIPEHKESREDLPRCDTEGPDPLEQDLRLGEELPNPTDMWTMTALSLFLALILVLAVLSPSTPMVADIPTWHLIAILSFSLLMSAYLQIVRRPRSIVIEGNGVSIRFRVSSDRFLGWGDIEYVVSSRPMLVNASWIMEDGLIKPYYGTPFKVRCDIVRKARSACRMSTGHDLKDHRMDMWGRITDKGRAHSPSDTGHYEVGPRQRNSMKASGPTDAPSAQGFNAVRPPVQSIIEEKRRWMACLYAIMMGFGHIYTEKYLKSALFISIFMAFILSLPFLGKIGRDGFIILAGAYIIIWVVQMIDAVVEVDRYNGRIRAAVDHTSHGMPVTSAQDTVADQMVRPVVTDNQRIKGMEEALTHEQIHLSIWRDGLKIDSFLILFFVVFTIITAIFLGSPGSLIALLLTIYMISLMLHSYLYARPTSVRIGRDGILLGFRFKKDHFMAWDDITRTSSRIESAIFTSMKNDGRIVGHGKEYYDMDPEVVKQVEEAYRREKGRCPLSMEEYQILRHSLTR